MSARWWRLILSLGLAASSGLGINSAMENVGFETAAAASLSTGGTTQMASVRALGAPAENDETVTAEQLAVDGRRDDRVVDATAFRADAWLDESSEHVIDGALLSSTATIRLDPDRDVIEVNTTYSMTNVMPDRTLGGGGYEYFFFDGVIVPVHSEATAMTVLVNDRPASFEIESDEGFDMATIEFDSDLRYDQTSTIAVNYELVGSPPRTPARVVRLNDAYASFDVFAFADDHAATVTVVVPEGWQVEHTPGPFGLTTASGEQIYEAADVAEPLDLVTTFAARNDDAFTSTAAAAGDAEFILHSWPGDDEWTRFANSHIEHGVPALEEVIGVTWPEVESTTVFESSSVYLGGYVGFHDTFANTIEVGEYFDTETMLHELAHAWFNDDTIDDRWLSEGLTQVAALQAMDQLAIPIESIGVWFPDEPTSSNRADAEPLPLNNWTYRDIGDEAIEDYGYATAELVLRELAIELDDDDFGALLEAVASGHRAYPTDSSDPEATATMGWRQFFDLAEQVGGSTTIDLLYREYIVAPGTQTAALDRRDDALESFEELTARGGDWVPPEAVRSEMATWDFDSAEQLIGLAHEALELRDELDDMLRGVGLASPASLANDYHLTTNLEQLIADLEADVAVAEQLAERHLELGGRLASIDVEAAQLLQEDYERDAAGLLEHSEGLLVQARELVDVERELEAMLAETGLEVPDPAPESFMDDPAATIETRSGLLAAATAVIEAREQRADSAGFVGWLGRLGRDVDRELEDAARHLGAGDAEAATAAATTAIDELDAAEASGPKRLTALAIATSLLLIAVGLIAVAIRHRRASKPRAASMFMNAAESESIQLPDSESPDECDAR